MLEGYTLTDENYTNAWEALENRYGDNRRRSTELQQEFMRLPPAQNNSQSLRNLLESVERISRQLNNLGVDVDESPFGLTSFKEKLPIEIRYKLREKEMESYYDWTFKDWCLALARIVTIRESEQPTRTFSSSNFKPSSSNFKRSNPQPIEGPNFKRSFNQPLAIQFPERVVSATNPNQNTSQNSINLECSLCLEEGHKPNVCPTYNTPTSRKLRLEEQNRCTNCAVVGHSITECKSRQRCNRCKARHHSLICTAKRTVTFSNSHPSILDGQSTDNWMLSPEEDFGNEF
jgi:hypothetical protein